MQDRDADNSIPILRHRWKMGSLKVMHDRHLMISISRISIASSSEDGSDDLSRFENFQNHALICCTLDFSAWDSCQMHSRQMTKAVQQCSSYSLAERLPSQKNVYSLLRPSGLGTRGAKA